MNSARTAYASAKKIAFGAALTCTVLFVAACGGGSEEEPQSAPAVTETPAATTSAATTTTSDAEETSSTETESSSDSSSSRVTGTRANASDSDEDEDVADARERFGSLAPDSVFDAFESCQPNGVQNSVACTGPEVGQVQFFKSDAKAASTTQLLTELRSSRVVEDTGRKVVGWSTLGNTAVITVVDNDLGLVMQQMISTDEQDPVDRIRELGLASESELEDTDSSDSRSERSDRDEMSTETSEARSTDSANITNA